MIYHHCGLVLAENKKGKNTQKINFETIFMDFLFTFSLTNFARPFSHGIFYYFLVSSLFNFII